MMADITITVELSPEIFIALKSLCAFYQKDEAQVVEMAITQMAADAQLITDTMDARMRKK